MLRRRSGKSSSRLNHRKSTSSIQTDRVDPVVSRQHAQAAASYAFARAQERKRADMSGSDGRQQCENLVTRRSSTISQVEPQIRRQQSVRFAGPNAVTRRQSIGKRASQDPLDIRTSTSTLRPRAITIDVPVPAEYRPPSRSSSLGKASIGRGKAENFVTALAAYDEYYTYEDDVASTPSSYRRIRKSKSMFSNTRTADAVVFNNGFPNIPARSNNMAAGSIISSSEPPEYSLKTPKSMSFLRGGREFMPPKVQQDRDSAVQIARDRFLHQLEQQRLNKQPSFLFRSRARREEKAPFRQSVRSSSTNSYGLPIASTNQNTLPEENKLIVKARIVSLTLKNKFKKIFTRNDGEEITLPDQQVTAHDTHVRSYVRTPDTVHGKFLNIPTPENGKISRVNSRAPSLHAVSSSQRLRSAAGSFESLHSAASLAKENSRVTSWNSTENSTVISRHAAAEREKQRLSVINENGTHVSSYNKNRETLLNQDSAFPNLVPQTQRFQGVPFQITSPVDSQRVYSALMKRLDDNSPHAKLEANKRASQQTLLNPIEVPARTTSANSHRISNVVPMTYSPATIRRVYGSDSTDFQENEVKTDPPSYHSGSGHGHEVIQNPLRPMNSVSTFHSTRSIYVEPNTNVPSGSNPDSHLILTPQIIANRDEPTHPSKRIIRERRSTFFPNAAFAVGRTTSPYRRALAEAERKEASLSQNPSNSTSINNSVTGNVDEAEDVEDIKADESRRAYSESVYSRTTSGRTPIPDSAISLALEDDEFPLGASSGNATVIGQATYRPTAPTHCMGSSSGSAEWRMWMGAQVSALNPPSNDKGVQSVAINFALPSMPKAYGHIRENAQISDDDTEIKTRKIAKGKQPVAMVQETPQQQKPIGILKNKSQVSLVSNDGSQKISSSALQVASEIPVAPPLPVLRMHAPIKLTKSRASLKSVETVTANHSPSTPSSAVKVLSISGRPVLQNRASTAALRSIGTPAKLVKRNRRPSKGTLVPSSPGMTAAVENQFGSANHTPNSEKTDAAKFRTPRTGMENYSPRAENNDEHGAVDSGLLGPKVKAQAMGSKKMVDLFLSTRRRRIQGSEESNAFL